MSPYQAELEAWKQRQGEKVRDAAAEKQMRAMPAWWSQPEPRHIEPVQDDPLPDYEAGDQA